MVSYMTPKAQATKAKKKIDKLDFTEIKNFSALKDTIMKIKRQPTGWEKIIVHHIADKRPVSV